MNQTMSNTSTPQFNLHDDSFTTNRLDSISENLLALSGIGQMYNGLLFDAENVSEKNKDFFPTLKKFGDGHFAYAIGRAIEILADDALEDVEKLQLKFKLKQDAQKRQEAP